MSNELTRVPVEEPAAPAAQASAPDRPGAAPASSPGWTAVACLSLFVVAGLLQLMQRAPFDADTAYHLAVARLMREHGILHAFPWTPFSWLADHYADKEWLFHVLLLPVAQWTYCWAARIAGTAMAGALLCATYLLLRAERVARAQTWTLLQLTASSAFVMRLAMVRPHLLSILLALLIAWAAARRRLRWVAVLSFLYPLTYVAWHLALWVVLMVEAAQLLSRRSIDWRPIAVTVVGLAAGLLVHPNFPQNVSLFWLQNVGVLVMTAWSKKNGFELGGEFLPFGAIDSVRYLAWPALLCLGACWRGWTSARKDPLPLAFALIAASFLLLTLKTQRFVEYLVPFAVVAAALASRERAPRWLPSALAAASLVWLAALGREPIRWLATREPDISTATAESLRADVPEGAQVFTCDWGLTGEMMLELPRRKFLVALDPVFFWKKDPALYALWYQIVRTPPRDLARVVRERFDAQYVLCDDRAQWEPLVHTLEGDPSVKTLLAGQWYLARLGASAATSTPSAPTAPTTLPR